jgi:hypothetical protein
MNIPAGVVQYPKAEDVIPGKPVSTLLLMFDGMTERPESGVQGVLEMLQSQVSTWRTLVPPTCSANEVQVSRR